MKNFFEVFVPRVDIPDRYLLTYRIGRGVLWMGMFFFVAYAFVKVAFPNEYEYFDFTQYYGPENTLIMPRLSQGEITRGSIPYGDTMTFNAIAKGEFESMHVRFSSQKSVFMGIVEMIRTYRAMFFPEGAPVTFPDGSLVVYNEKYFFVSNGVLREISKQNFDLLGFSREQFLEISDEEFAVHSIGNPVNGNEYWMENALFRDEKGRYFQIKEGRKDSFVSERAYLSQYRVEDARVLNRKFSDSDASKLIGFIDGTLLSYDGGVYAIEGGFVRPIDSPEAFLAKGYDWGSVISATKEEFSAYERGDIYGMERPHISGTLFFDKEENRYFLIENDVRREIFGKNILEYRSAVMPVFVDATPTVVRCTIESKVFGWYGCDADIDGVGSGAEYRFVVIPENDVQLKSMKMVLVRGVSMESFRLFLSEMKSNFFLKE